MNASSVGVHLGQHFILIYLPNCEGKKCRSTIEITKQANYLSHSKCGDYQRCQRYDGHVIPLHEHGCLFTILWLKFLLNFSFRIIFEWKCYSLCLSVFCWNLTVIPMRDESSWTLYTWISSVTQAFCIFSHISQSRILNFNALQEIK